jgi:predicted dehydrogenase
MTKFKPLNILIVGGGMYVCGRGTDNFGTILPAVLEAKKKGYINKIFLSTTSSQSSKIACKQFVILKKLMNVDFQIDFFPKNNKNNNSYLDVINKNNIDAAIVAVPDHLHAEICIKIIKQSIHCLVVKPLAPTVIEAKKMIQTAKKYKVVSEVEFHKRFDMANLILHNKIKNNELGKLQYAIIEYSQKKIMPEKFFSQWVSKSNIFQYLGVHYVDLISFLTSFKPLGVIAWGQKDYLKSKKINTWDSIQVNIKWKRKDGGIFLSSHFQNWIDPNFSSSMSDQKINIVGTGGRYNSDQKNRGVQFVSDKHGINDINPYFTYPITDPGNNILSTHGYGIDSVLCFFQDIKDYKNKIKTLKNLDDTRPTFKSTLISTIILEAALKSLNNDNKYINLGK